MEECMWFNSLWKRVSTEGIPNIGGGGTTITHAELARECTVKDIIKKVCELVIDQMAISQGIEDYWGSIKIGRTEIVKFGTTIRMDGVHKYLMNQKVKKITVANEWNCYTVYLELEENEDE